MKVQLSGLINRVLTLILFDDETRTGYFSDKAGNQYKIPYHFYADTGLNTSHVYVLENGRQEVLLGLIEEGEYFTLGGALYRKKLNVENPDDWEDIVIDRCGNRVKLHIEIPVLRFK